MYPSRLLLLFDDGLRSLHLLSTVMPALLACLPSVEHHTPASWGCCCSHCCSHCCCCCFGEKVRPATTVFLYYGWFLVYYSIIHSYKTAIHGTMEWGSKILCMYVYIYVYIITLLLSFSFSLSIHHNVLYCTHILSILLSSSRYFIPDVGVTD
jgi:hypothetical protein